ncbi:hypothetical protein PFISCL1PPCAC_25209, partial [Pristionchus fissidentatus]
RPHIVLIPTLGVVVSILLPFIAFDRFIAVLRPFYYYKMDSHCACKLAGLITLVFICCGITLFIVGLRGSDRVEHCHPLDFFSGNTITIFLSIVWFGHLASVLLYAAVVVVIEMKIREQSKTLKLPIDYRFRAIEKTFAVFAVLTVILIVVPIAFLAAYENVITMLKNVYGLRDEHVVDLHAISRLVLKFTSLNPTLNVVCYAFKHKQIHRGFRQVFSKKISKVSTSLSHYQPTLTRLGAKSSILTI